MQRIDRLWGAILNAGPNALCHAGADAGGLRDKTAESRLNVALIRYLHAAHCRRDYLLNVDVHIGHHGVGVPAGTLLRRGLDLIHGKAETKQIVLRLVEIVGISLKGRPVPLHLGLLGALQFFGKCSKGKLLLDQLVVSLLRFLAGGAKRFQSVLILALCQLNAACLKFQLVGQQVHVHGRFFRAGGVGVQLFPKLVFKVGRSGVKAQLVQFGLERIDNVLRFLFGGLLGAHVTLDALGNTLYNVPADLLTEYDRGRVNAEEIPDAVEQRSAELLHRLLCALEFVLNAVDQAVHRVLAESRKDFGRRVDAKEVLESVDGILRYIHDCILDCVHAAGNALDKTVNDMPAKVDDRLHKPWGVLLNSLSKPVDKVDDKIKSGVDHHRDLRGYRVDKFQHHGNRSFHDLSNVVTDSLQEINDDVAAGLNDLRKIACDGGKKLRQQHCHRVHDSGGCCLNGLHQGEDHRRSRRDQRGSGRRDSRSKGNDALRDFHRYCWNKVGKAENDHAQRSYDAGCPCCKGCRQCGDADSQCGNACSGRQKSRTECQYADADQRQSAGQGENGGNNGRKHCTCYTNHGESARQRDKALGDRLAAHSAQQTQHRCKDRQRTGRDQKCRRTGKRAVHQVQCQSQFAECNAKCHHACFNLIPGQLCQLSDRVGHQFQRRTDHDKARADCDGIFRHDLQRNSDLSQSNAHSRQPLYKLTGVKRTQIADRRGEDLNGCTYQNKTGSDTHHVLCAAGEFRKDSKTAQHRAETEKPLLHVLPVHAAKVANRGSQYFDCRSKYNDARRRADRTAPELRCPEKYVDLCQQHANTEQPLFHLFPFHAAQFRADGR